MKGATSASQRPGSGACEARKNTKKRHGTPSRKTIRNPQWSAIQQDPFRPYSLILDGLCACPRSTTPSEARWMVEAGHRNRWKGVRAVERDEGLGWFRGPGAGATDEFVKHHRWIVEPHAVIECVGVSLPQCCNMWLSKRATRFI